MIAKRIRKQNEFLKSFLNLILTQIYYNRKSGKGICVNDLGTN